MPCHVRINSLVLFQQLSCPCLSFPSSPSHLLFFPYSSFFLCLSQLTSLSPSHLVMFTVLMSLSLQWCINLTQSWQDFSGLGVVSWPFRACPFLYSEVSEKGLWFSFKFLLTTLFLPYQLRIRDVEMYVSDKIFRLLILAAHKIHKP